MSVPAPRLPRAAASRLAVERVGRDEFSRLLALLDGHAAQNGDRGAYGAPRMSVCEFEEALLDPPFFAFAWIATRDGQDVGYAACSVGFSTFERGYYLAVEALHATLPRLGTERALLRTMENWAREIGCVNLQWHVTQAEHEALRAAAPHRMHVVNVLQHVLPLSA